MAEFTEDEFYKPEELEAVKVVPDGEVIGHPQAGLSEEMKNEIGDAENLVFEWQSKYELEVRREAVTAQEEAMMALEAAQNKLKDLKAMYMPIHQDREVFYEKHIENRGSGSAYEPRKPAPDPKPISELQEFLKPVPVSKTTKKGKAKGKRKNK